MSLTGKAAVVGATGRQGGAVARHLLSGGWQVRALTRDTQQPSAQALAAQGAELVAADLDDPSSLEAALGGMDSLFAVTNFWQGAPGPILGAEGEARQGTALVEAARQAGIGHVVLSSAAGAFGPISRMAHVASKQKIERHLMASGLAWTILRPVFFMENLTVPWMGVWQGIEQGQLSLPLAENRKLQMVSVDDIGFYAALALTERETFVGTAFDIAGDELTGTEMADQLSTHLGTNVAFVSTAAGIEAMRAEHEDGAVMWEEINAVGTNGFLPGLRGLHPRLSSFRGFLSAGLSRPKS